MFTKHWVYNWTRDNRDEVFECQVYCVLDRLKFSFLLAQTLLWDWRPKFSLVLVIHIFILMFMVSHCF